MRIARIEPNSPANQPPPSWSVAPATRFPMKKSLLFTTLLAGLVLAGCNRSTQTDTASTDPAMTTPSSTSTTSTAATTTEPTVGQRVDNAADRAGDAIADASRSARNSIEQAADNTGDALSRAGNEISAEWNEWKLSAQDLEADLRADRPIVRTRSAAGAPTGNVDKSQLKSNVQASVQKHAASIEDLDVEIDNQTEVVLTGEAMSADQVGKAIGSALSTEGVTKVTSKIKLKE